jgi:predicted RNA binding protein YcfA (HicA-like mRNA interferase family)
MQITDSGTVMSKLAREVRKLLNEAGWQLLRQGKGDHEIWHEPVTGRKVTVNNSINSRHTANAIMKQAGLSKSF